MMYHTDDPVADYMRYDADREREREKLPKCICCGEPIDQETAVCIDGEWWCDECLKSMRRYTVA